MQCLRFDLETQWQPYPVFRDEPQVLPSGSLSNGTSNGFEKLPFPGCDVESLAETEESQVLMEEIKLLEIQRQIQVAKIEMAKLKKWI